MRGPMAHVGVRRSAYRDLVEKPERKRPLGRPRHRWEGDIEMCLKLSGKAENKDMVVVSCECSNGSIKCEEFLG